MKKLASVLLIFGTMVNSGGQVCAAGEISVLKNVIFEDQRLTVNLSRPAKFRTFAHSAPAKIVLELSDTVLESGAKEFDVEKGIVKRVRVYQFQSEPVKISRVVVDLSDLVSYEVNAKDSDILLTLGRKVETPVVLKTPPALKDESASPPALKDESATSSPPEKNKEGTKTIPSSDKVVAGGEALSSFRAKPGAKPVKKEEKDSGKVKVEGIILPVNEVSFDFIDTDIRDVLRMASEMSGVNIVYGTDVAGTVTLHIEKVPFNEAMETVFAMKNLVALPMGDNILRIMTPEMLALERAKVNTYTRVYTLAYALAGDVKSYLDSIRVSENRKGTISVDSRSNSLIITDSLEGLASAERLIAGIDKKPGQVMIEAKIVELQLSNDFDLGIQWEIAHVEETGGRTLTGVGTVEVADKAIPGKVNFTRSDGKSVAPNPPSVGQRGTGVNLPGGGSSTLAAITFGIISNTTLLAATLNALIEKSQGKILSSPKIITLNNKEAKIQVGSKIPFSITSVAATGVATQSFQFVDVGIMLTVTPTINAENQITVKVRPEVSTPGPQQGTVGPQIDTRTAETTVMVKNGETIVIGGLIDEQTRELARKVPLLGSIPVLGNFFRSQSESKERRELLILLTPSLINN